MDGSFLESLAPAIVETLRQPLLLLDVELRVIGVNRAFCLAFSVAAKDAIGRRLPELATGALLSPELLELLDRVIDFGVPFDDAPLRDPRGGGADLLCSGRRLLQPPGRPALVLLQFDQ